MYFFNILKKIYDANKQTITKKYLFNHTYVSLKDYIYEKYNINISKTLLMSKQYVFDAEYFENINKNLLNYFYESIIKKKNGRLLSCDGTVSKVNISLKKYNYSSVPTDSYCEFYISTLYDSENNVPIYFTISKKLDERESFKDLINHVKKDDIVLFDRGYPSDKFMMYLNENNIKYIIRAKCNHFAVIDIGKLGISEKIYTKIDPLYKGFDFRIIKYVVKSPKKNMDYFVLTNLFEIKADNFCDLYFKRWKIEVYYDKFKNYVNGGEYDVKSETELHKAVYIKYYGILITQIIISYIRTIFEDNKKTYINDFSSALRITHNLIIYDMIYYTNNYRKFFAYLVKINSTVVQSIPNRSFLHYPTKDDINNSSKETLKNNKNLLVEINQ